jgi:hypothetical protein
MKSSTHRVFWLESLHEPSAVAEIRIRKAAAAAGLRRCSFLSSSLSLKTSLHPRSQRRTRHQTLHQPDEQAAHKPPMRRTFRLRQYYACRHERPHCRPSRLLISVQRRRRPDPVELSTCVQGLPSVQRPPPGPPPPQQRSVDRSARLPGPPACQQRQRPPTRAIRWPLSSSAARRLARLSSVPRTPAKLPR